MLLGVYDEKTLSFRDPKILIFKTDSAQSSSNKCKNYLLKIYPQHIKVLNTIWNVSL